VPNLTTVTDFPPWAIDYASAIQNPVTRTQQRGFSRQSSFSQRRVTTVSASRRLAGIELPFFESFVRTQCNDGQLSFTDRYKDGDGVQTGIIRIVDGYYSVSTNGRNHVVTCVIEVFR
jgi:hypothetical protein